MSNLYGQTYQLSPPNYVPTPPSPGFGRGAGASGGYVEPGSVVYTTTARQDGQILYSLFRAQPSSYQTAQGRVDGIQWELVEVTPVMPVNFPPADRNFYNAWGPNGEKERQRMVDNWLFDQNSKINRREDLGMRGGPTRYQAQAQANAADWERQRRAQAQAEAQALAAAEEDYAILREQERRGRRISANPIYGSGAGSDYRDPPYTTPTTRARSKSYSRYEQADEELARAMGKVDLDRAEYEYEEQQRRDRRRSMSRGPVRGGSRNPSPVGRLSDYTISPSAPLSATGTRPRNVSFSAAYPTAAEYSQGATYASYGGGDVGSTANYMQDQQQQGGVLFPIGGPLYPPGHILAGKPIPGLQPNERLPMQMGGSGGSVTSYRSSSPRPQQLVSPGGIPSYRSSSPRPEALYRSSSRPRSRAPSRAPSPSPVFTPPPSFFRPLGAASYTYFDAVLITPDLNRMYKELPHLPSLLLAHDVRPEDWTRCVNDILTSWFNNTTNRPANQLIAKKPAKMVAQLLDVWNASFFSLRGVEMTLYRGHQRCSGPQAGRYDAHLDNRDYTGGRDYSNSSSSDLSTISSDSDSNDANYEYLGYGTTSRYLPADGQWIANSRRAEKARKDARRLKAKQFAQQQKKREILERRRKEGLPYSIYVHCVGDGKPLRNTLSDAASAAYTAALTGGRGY